LSAALRKLRGYMTFKGHVSWLLPFRVYYNISWLQLLGAVVINHNKARWKRSWSLCCILQDGHWGAPKTRL